MAETVADEEGRVKEMALDDEKDHRRRARHHHDRSVASSRAEAGGQMSVMVIASMVWADPYDLYKLSCAPWTCQPAMCSIPLVVALVAEDSLSLDSPMIGHVV